MMARTLAVFLLFFSPLIQARVAPPILNPAELTPRELAILTVPSANPSSIIATSNAFQSASGPPFSLYPTIPAIFAFGDGGQDVGNGLYLGHDLSPAYYPYGSSFYNITGRLSNGRVFSDHFAEALGLPFLTPSLAPNGSFYTGCSFASVSTGRFNDTGDQDGFQGIPLLKQVENFVQFQRVSRAYWAGFNATNPPELTPRYPHPDFFDQAMYMVQSGGNDLVQFRNRGFATRDISAYAQNMTNVYETFIRSMYSAGARKFFVMNIGLFGCTPLSIRNNGGVCGTTTNALCDLIVNGTVNLAETLSAQLPNSSFVVGDFYQFNLDAYNNPASFGFVNVTWECCGAPNMTCSQLALGLANKTVPYRGSVPLCPNPSQYLYWDSVRMSERATQILAHDIFGGSKYGVPKNILQTFVLPGLLNL